MGNEEKVPCLDDIPLLHYYFFFLFPRGYPDKIVRSKLRHFNDLCTFSVCLVSRRANWGRGKKIERKRERERKWTSLSQPLDHHLENRIMESSLEVLRDEKAKFLLIVFRSRSYHLISRLLGNFLRRHEKDGSPVSSTNDNTNSRTPWSKRKIQDTKMIKG